MLDADEDEETIGDRIHITLGDDSDVIESVDVLGRTVHARLPETARLRLGMYEGAGQRAAADHAAPLDRTLTSDQTNAFRNRIYLAVYDGPVRELF